ncbi:unnamed protein product [Trichogramma brassicae]|uniref:Uncharacterized protein n=1 Tax=Trichogramma brassicae TaxID=86971 RepID=A0A6H5IB61_9HYME|nr:unnamed protein product [Trichogramma brassicae]
MGGLGFRTRNSPSQKTSLRWGDCCPSNLGFPISGIGSSSSSSSSRTQFPIFSRYSLPAPSNSRHYQNMVFFSV